MFKNLMIYRMTASWALSAAQVEEAVAAHAHTDIGLSQMVSTGWVPIHDGLFTHVVNRQILLQFKTEKRTVPSSALKAAVKEKIDQHEQQTGRKPGKKESRSIKEDTLMTLLPKVLPTQTQTRVWIDPINGWIVINTGSQSQADAIITALIKALDKLELQTLHIAKDPGAVMTEWLSTQDGPTSFSIDRACELKASDETRAVVKYKNAGLDTDDVRRHIREGKRCTQLALTYEDRVSFVLTEKFRVKSIRFLDVVFTDSQETRDERESFDADFVIMTSELTKMLDALVAALGGEQPREPKPETDDLFV